MIRSVPRLTNQLIPVQYFLPNRNKIPSIRNFSIRRSGFQSCFLGLFYDAYLQEVIKVLEKDEDFRKKMENVNFEDIKIATFSKELNSVAKHVRDELDNLKRKEVDRIRS